MHTSKSEKKYTSRAAAIERVEEELRLRIKRGHWQPGVMLPSRRDLAKYFDIDLHTLQRAISPLLAEGMLRADGGRGTFVSLYSNTSCPDPVRFAESQFAESQFAASRFTTASTGKSASGKIYNSSLARRPGTLGIMAAYDTTPLCVYDCASIGTREILRSLEKVFLEAGGQTVFFNLMRTDCSCLTVLEAAEVLLAKGVEALAVVNIQNNSLLGDLRLMEEMSEAMPVIHISGSSSYQPPVHVFYDQRQAGYQVAEHLVQIGCRKLLFLVPFAASWLEERVEGIRIALHNAHLPADSLLVYPLNHPLQTWSSEVEPASAEALRQAFADNFVEGGVIVPNDGVAHLFLKIAGEYHRLPGRDYALIGFEDVPDSSFRNMTSLRPPFEEMGREAGHLLLRQLGGEQVTLQVCLRAHLMVRDSTRQYAVRCSTSFLKEQTC